MKTKKQKFEGEFYTPKIWVDEAHKMITEEFGVDWKEKYIVWDCAWGSGNLTRDYKFKELYCSTLHQSDIDKSDANKESIRFQFDFLNDDLDELKYKAPKLLDAINSGKQIIFFINPPYGTAKHWKEKKGDSKTGIAKNNVNDEMKPLKFGEATKNLYTQFLYKISKIYNSKICVFSPPLYLSSTSFENFRNYFFKKYNLLNGFYFNSTEFADVSEWTLSFLIWNNQINKNNIFYIKIKENIDFEITTTNIKKIKIIKKLEKFSEFIKNKKIKKHIIYPNLSSSFNVSDKEHKIPNEYLSTFNNGSNIIEKNEKECSIISAPYSGNIGQCILKNNFKKCISLFSCRKLITGKHITWKNMKDEYITPSKEIQKTKKYKQFNNDIIIHMLYKSRNYVTSMRNIKYKDKLWNIKNEFFWLSKDDMK